MKRNLNRIIENGRQFLGFKKSFNKNGICGNYFILKVKWLISLITLGCSADEFFIFHFYEKKLREQKEYVTLLKGKFLIRKFNGKGNRAPVEDKAIFHEYFKDYLYREVKSSEQVNFEEFKNFYERKRIIIKPQNGFNGNGIFILEPGMDQEELKRTYKKIKNGNYVLEEVLEQDGILKQLNPGTLNTIRVNVFNNHGKIEIINAFLRTGQGNTVTDNISAGGCLANINKENGCVETDFCDFSSHTYRKHPLSGTVMKGKVIPSWNKVIEVATKAALIVSDLAYTSWDIAVIKDGDVAIVEGNSYGNFNAHQIFTTGDRKQYERYIKEWKRN